MATEKVSFISRKLSFLIGLVGLLLVNSNCYALPGVTNVTGDMNNGSSISIAGSGFGPTGPNIVVFDDFESGASNQLIKTGPGSATVGNWDALLIPNPTYTDTTHVSGNKSLQGFLNNYSASGAPGVMKYLPANTTDIFLCYNMYLPAGDNWPGENTGLGINWKLMWVTGANTNIHDQWIPAMNDPSAGSQNIAGNNTPFWGWIHGWPAFEKGKWYRVWAWLKGRTDNTGAIRAWTLTNNGVAEAYFKNGGVVIPNINTPTMYAGYYEKLYVNAYARRETLNSHPTLDDVYASTGPGAQARVEIGNASTYAACTNLTLATVTSWTDTSIHATIRQGKFAAGTSAYLYVIDANGNMNTNGYPISIGNSIGSISAPTNLKVM